MIIIKVLTLLVPFLWYRQMIDIEKSKTRKVRSQKKSSEVRLGQTSEQLAPFLDGFNHDAHELQFMGRPIDYIHFGDDTITFIEVKSGKSRLSKKQRKVRDLIKNNKVQWEVFRIDGKD